jgi:hypothetical protein
MTKRLEEVFNLPPLTGETDTEHTPTVADARAEIEVVQDAISVTEKINDAFRQIRGLEEHEADMDDIAEKAIDSYTQLMNLGMNVSDMAAGKVFAEASNMLKIALEAKDHKTQRKLDQINLMIKKARLDKIKNLNGEDTPDSGLAATQSFDRNELLRIIRGDK